MKQLKWYILFFTAFALLGFLREFFFVHLNNIMYGVYYQRETSLPIPSSMRFFLDYSYDTLYYSKYLFTLAFTLLYFLVSLFALKAFGLPTYFKKILIYTYLILLLLAASSMLYGVILNERLNDDEYTISRWLLGVAQSPIVCLILLASAKLYKHSVESNPEP